MKYTVLDIINTRLDSCTPHESGACTCSDGNGDLFWVLNSHGLFESMEDAYRKAKELREDALNRHKIENPLNDGWEYADDMSCVGITAFKYLPEGFEEELWVERFVVVEIDA